MTLRFVVYRFRICRTPYCRCRHWKQFT